MAFDRYFGDIISEIVPLSREVIDLATSLRARYGFKTPDCIHLAAAIVNQCDLFLTNDRRLCRCRDIAVEVV
jgi:predicted nucleic acid-binding protein